MEKRIVIIGNSGSGKSHVARVLGAIHGLEVVHLDHLFWMPGGFNQKRSAEWVHAEIEVKKETATWIVEGVFGELADLFLDRADLLIWLDLPWEACRASLLARGSESSKQLNPKTAEASFQQLLAWAGNYGSRSDGRSHVGHGKMFTAFPGAKMRFDNRDDVNRFLEFQKKTSPAVRPHE